MIEVLIDYIRKKGYTVDVGPHILIIRKTFQGELCSIAWGIFQEDLRPEFEQILYLRADEKCKEIETAAIERFGAVS